MSKFALLSAAGLAAGALLLGFAASLHAEEFNLGNRPWDFSTRNHAGIAALIEQKANGTIGGGNGIGKGGGCGPSAGHATAAGNVTCIIIGDGSTGIIEIDQDSAGNQDANAQTSTSGNNSMSSTLETLMQ